MGQVAEEQTLAAGAAPALDIATPRTELSNAYFEFKRASSADDSVAARQRVLNAREAVAGVAPSP